MRPVPEMSQADLRDDIDRFELDPIDDDARWLAMLDEIYGDGDEDE
jgi:hypothetical protein